MHTHSSMPIALLLAQHGFLHVFLQYGWLGLLLLSVVDASFVPLPLPGAADLLIALLASRQHTWMLLVLASSVGSVIGGASCYYVGMLGGVQLLEKRIPPRYFKRVTEWVECHAFLAVSIPAILPPPFPLIPFTIAAGALKMPKRKFFLSFAVSRFLRHLLFAWLGLRYAAHLRGVWRIIESPWMGWVLGIFWTIVLIAVVYGCIQLVRTQRSQATVTA